jgi:hypothetical protein
VFLLLSGFVRAANNGSANPVPPNTPLREVTDTYFGNIISDP